MRKKRRNYTPEEKVLIIKPHLVEAIAVSALCDKYQVNGNKGESRGSSYIKNSTAQGPQII